MATKTLTVDLPAEIFDVQTNVPLIHQVVVGQLAAEALGLDPAQVEVQTDHTELTGSSGSASASRMSFMAVSYTHLTLPTSDLV